MRAPRVSIEKPTVTGLVTNTATLWTDALAAGLQPGPHLAGPDDLCVMPYTSGTTGRPKGCIHSHATVMSTVVIMSAWGASHQDSTVLGTLPLFHVTGMQGAMNAPIYTGAGVVLMTRWDRDTAPSSSSDTEWMGGRTSRPWRSTSSQIRICPSTTCPA